MGTEKNILTETLCTGMNSQDESKGEKKSLDAFLGRKELDLERWVGESEKNYCERLLAIYSTQNGLISAYEREKELDRYRKTDSAFADLLERGSEENKIIVKGIILRLQEEVQSYIQKFSHLLEKKAIQEKLNDLESIT